MLPVKKECYVTVPLPIGAAPEALYRPLSYIFARSAVKICTAFQMHNRTADPFDQTKVLFIMHLRILLAFSNMLFSTGIEKILESDPSVKVVRILRPKEVLGSLKDEPDIILADLISLYNYIDKSCLASACKLILLDTECGKVNIAAAIANRKVSMVLPQHSMPEDLLSAIKRVAKESRTDKAIHLQNSDFADR